MWRQTHLLLASIALLVVAGMTGAEAAAETSPMSVRALWVTRWDYRAPGDVAKALADAEAAGFNHVFFQVRGEGDAFYRSALEPWGRGLAEPMGKDPGWDPLAVAIEEARDRNLTLHAWINVLAGWKGPGEAPETSPPQWVRNRPEWAARNPDGETTSMAKHGYVFMAPGHLGVRYHLMGVVEDLLSRYEVDGLHLDYIRSPGAEFVHDPETQRRLALAQAADSNLVAADFHRDQVTALVEAISGVARATRPGIILSAAVIGTYEKPAGWAATEALHDCYQDGAAWVRRGLLDYIVPMMYWPMEATAKRPPYYEATARMYFEAAGKDRVLPGLILHYEDFAEVEGQLDWLAEEQAMGFAAFALSDLRKRGHGKPLAAYWRETPAE